MGIQEILTESGGRAEWLGDSDRHHLESCESCSRVMVAEQGLAEIFEAVLPPDDPKLQAAIMKALGRARKRRKVLVFLPVAASLLVALVGAAMLGGVPGSSLLGLLPAWSAQGWLSVAELAGDWQIVAASTADALPDLVSPAVQVVAGLLFIGGLAGLGISLRRWRKLVSWRRDG